MQGVQPLFVGLWRNSVLLFRLERQPSIIGILECIVTAWFPYCNREYDPRSELKLLINSND